MFYHSPLVFNQFDQLFVISNNFTVILFNNKLEVNLEHGICSFYNFTLVLGLLGWTASNVCIL